MSNAFRVLRASQASLQGKAMLQQQVRLASTAITRFSGSSGQKKSIFVGIATSLLIPSASVALCQGKDDGFFDAIVKKDRDGNTDWAGSIGQVTEGDFWDKVATASGDKVGVFWLLRSSVGYGVQFSQKCHTVLLSKDSKCL